MERRAEFGLGARLLAVLLAAALLAMMAVLPQGAARAAQPGSGPGALPVSGKLSDGGTFQGTVSDLRASVDRDGDLVVSGVLNGTATLADGTVREVSDQPFTTTASVQQGEVCDILFLDIGPIYLDLLGLTVDLSPITLDVNAVPGPGNLLGNLLCAITGLLDRGAPANAVANLLNQVFSLLR